MRRLQAENTLHRGGPGAEHTVAEDDPQAVRDALVEQVSYSTVAWILYLVGSEPQLAPGYPYWMPCTGWTALQLLHTISALVLAAISGLPLPV